MDTIYKVAAILVFPKYAVYFKLHYFKLMRLQANLLSSFISTYFAVNHSVSQKMTTRFFCQYLFIVHQETIPGNAQNIEQLMRKGLICNNTCSRYADCAASGHIYYQLQRSQHIVNMCYCRLGAFSSIVLCFVYFQVFFS